MAYAITQSCCTDATCVSVCPVNCIHPTPDDADFGNTEILHIDPRACIDCGACADACPVDAIVPTDLLTEAQAPYAARNERYFTDRPAQPGWAPPRFPRSLPAAVAAPRVAVVGTGPAAAYTARGLLRSTGARVTLLDRLPAPGGLVRFGVAPDHVSTRRMGDGFAALYRHPRVRLFTGVEVGVHVDHAELLAHHDAVVYATGAGSGRGLAIPGADLPGVLPATTVVGWYTGHPDVPRDAVEMSGHRAVVVGTGNVALDVARVLLGDPDALARTEIAGHALAAIRSRAIREVVLLGRGGPERAAFTRTELLAMRHLPGVDLVVDDHPEVRAEIDGAAEDGKAALLRGLAVHDGNWSATEQRAPAGRRIVLRFRSTPVAVDGPDRARAVRVARTAQGAGAGPAGEHDRIDTSLVILATGNRGRPVATLPFDDETGTIPNTAGRVIDTGRIVAGTYVAGWIKRGPAGGIGANRTCADQTVHALLDDAAAGRLPTPPRSAADFARLVRRRTRPRPAADTNP